MLQSEATRSCLEKCIEISGNETSTDQESEHQEPHFSPKSVGVIALSMISDVQ